MRINEILVKQNNYLSLLLLVVLMFLPAEWGTVERNNSKSVSSIEGAIQREIDPGMFTEKSVHASSYGSSDHVEGIVKKRTIEVTDGWRFKRVGGEAWYEATVPGCIHTDLLAHRLIEEPFYRDNEKRLQWIEGEEWEYETTFQVGEELLERETVEIHFSGLDTYVSVYLNDSLLFFANNMFREWKQECKAMLKNGDNTIRVVFHSPAKEALPLWNDLVYELPGGPKVVTRKAGYHYGWDWGPRFVTSGIWRPVYLEAWDRAEIENIQIIQKRVAADKAVLTAVFKIESTAHQRAEVSLSHMGKKLGAVAVQLVRGKNAVNMEFEIDEPRLWWANGLGEAFLYHLQGELRIEDTVVDEMTERIGIRTVKLVRKRDQAGEKFSFELNGVPVFMKGANYIPQDNFVTRVTPNDYETLIESVVNANMNMLRVWGGGIYENDIFYDMCDENGILVWQDFMFACAMYPGDSTFLQNVEREAVQNVKRLRNHPCIALWCGNNEIDEGWHNWGWQRYYGYSSEDSADIWHAYEHLFHDLLPKIVERYAGDRPYWPSSPQYGRADPRSFTEGDSHYWGVWHDGEPFEVFKERTGRFMSEYGFQSFPEFKTVKSFTMPEDWDIESDVMLSHQKHPRGNQLIKTYMERDYRVPKEFELFLSVSQLLQAEGMKIAIEAHRRAKPYCMGTMYWQLNDCWPVASWSSIDYEGRWKALHYYVKRAYTPVLVSPTVDNSTLSVYIISDSLQTIRGVLKLRLWNFSGEVVWEKEIESTIEANSSASYFDERVETVIKGRSKVDIVFEAEVWYDQERLSRNLYYFLPPKDLDLPRPVITKRINPSDEGYTIELTSDRLAKNVFLSIDDINGFFTENYFDILPGETVDVDFIVDERVDGIAEKIKVTSLVDTF